MILSTDQTTESREQLTRERWVILAAVITTGMAFIDATALHVVLPALQAELGATGKQLLWIVNAYGLMVAALLLASGAAGDCWGRKRVYMIGIACFGAFSLLCGLAPNTPILIAARGLQGTAAALMIPGSLALITTTVPAGRRGKAIGVWSAASVVMTALGPLLGGLFVRAGWWRGVFLINLPLATIALIVLALQAAESCSQRSHRFFDVWGVWWITCGLASLNLALLESSNRGLRDGIVWAGLLIGITSLLLFIFTESRATVPILPLQLFQIKTLNAVCLISLLFYSGLYAMTLFLSLNLIQVQGYSALSAGLAQLPIMLCVVVLAPWIGQLVDRGGPRHLLILGSALAGVGYLALTIPAVSSGPSEYWGWFLPSLLLLGLGMSLIAVPLSTSIVEVVGLHFAGLGSGLNSTLSRLSSVLGIAVMGPVGLATFSHSLAAHSLALPLTEGQRAALLSEAALLGGAAAPPDLSVATHNAVEHAIKFSFIAGFRTVSYMCAAACLISAVLAACLLANGPVRSETNAVV